MLLIPLNLAKGGPNSGSLRCGMAAWYVTERRFPVGRWDEWSGEEEEAGLTV